MPFILEKNNAEYEQIEIAPLTLSFVEQIPSELTFDFVEKHKLAKEEITQEIIELRIETLQNPPAMWDTSLRFCLIQNDENEIVAYGIGHNYYEKRNSYYVNTIYVHPEYRARGFSKAILNEFIKHFLTLKNFNELYAVTQPNNNRAIELLRSKSFNYLG
ncbi:MAG: GNAT family N-acetyltransferase [Chitinophagaceae bacterium]|mgnify:CR=1 FL=1|jgi:ribosomal protein S18 acetylase RimI-like enzyme|nr:GNAT family N-acetyltransferase [Chitinophagaceae bacterium]